MLFYIFFLMFFIKTNTINCSHQEKPKFMTCPEWKSDTKTPEAGTPKSGNTSEKSSSFHKDTSKLQTCILRARQSISKGALSSDLISVTPAAKSSEKELDVLDKSKNHATVPSAEAEGIHFFNDEHNDSAPDTEITATKTNSSSRSHKLKSILSVVKIKLDMNQRRLSESLRRNSSNPMNSSDQANTTMYTDDNSSSLSISSLSSPVLSATTAGIALGTLGTIYANNQQPQRRSMLSAGDIFGVGTTASSISWIATLVASGIAISQIKDWLHSSCRADKTVMHEEFKKLLQNHKLETKQDMNHIIEQCNKLIMENQEENNEVIQHLLEALEETSILLENNDKNNNVSVSPAVILKEAVKKGKNDLAHNNKQNGIQKLPALSKKTTCTSCWCCGSDDE